MDPLTQITATLSGDDFEDFFWGLLRRKYPQTDLVYLPALMNGDYGLEGFSTDGIVYQCYADQDSATLRHRTDKQKNKLYTDTVKLQTYSSKISGVLGDLKISHYFLCVPEFHAAELIKHAQVRAAAVRGFGLNWITADFSIRIKTKEDYPAEFKAAQLDGAAKPVLPSVQVDNQAVSGFENQEPSLASTLTHKLAQLKAHHPSANMNSLQEIFIRSFLDKEQVLAHLSSWPETREAVEVQRRSRQDALEMESALGLNAPESRLNDLIIDYATQLKDACAITPADASRLARGQAGEWLMRCPMSFADKT